MFSITEHHRSFFVKKAPPPADLLVLNTSADLAAPRAFPLRKRLGKYGASVGSAFEVWHRARRLCYLVTRETRCVRGNYAAMASALIDLRALVENNTGAPIASIAMMRIGCGRRSRLSWKRVKHLILITLGCLPLVIDVYHLD